MSVKCNEVPKWSRRMNRRKQSLLYAIGDFLDDFLLPFRMVKNLGFRHTLSLLTTKYYRASTPEELKYHAALDEYFRCRGFDQIDLLNVFYEQRRTGPRARKVFVLPDSEEQGYARAVSLKRGQILVPDGVVQRRRYWNGKTEVVLDYELAQRIQAKHLESQQPPSHAKFLLLLIPKKYREYLVGDLEEEFRTVTVVDYGPTVARFLYWWQVVLALLEALVALVGALALIRLI